MQFLQRERPLPQRQFAATRVQGAFCLTPNSLVIFSTLAKNLNNGQSDVSIFDTAVGVIVALAVNYYLPREKVVPLWEGFKARISGKSAK